MKQEYNIEYEALYIKVYKKKELLCVMAVVVFWDDADRLVFAIEDASIIVVRDTNAHAFDKFPLFAYSI
jgi:hypothetical protein